MKLTEDDWLEEYQPIEDEANLTDLWDTDDPILKVIKPEHIWTLVEEDDDGYIVSGFQFVNRLGYYITRKAWTESIAIKCNWPKED